jgi:hypothetical protein
MTGRREIPDQVRDDAESRQDDPNDSVAKKRKKPRKMYIHMAANKEN